VVVTKFGRVELDPLRVPLCAAAACPPKGTFAEQLQEQSRQQESAKAPAATKTTTEEPTREATRRAPAATQEKEVEAPAHDQAPATRDNEPQPAQTLVDGRAPLQETVQKRVAPQQPADPQAAPAEPRLAPAVASAPAATTAAVGGAAAPAVVVAAPAAAAASAQQIRAGLERALAPAVTAPARPVAGEAQLAGFRTLNAQAVQLNEQARDSVFKQILFKLGKEQSEMRMRLDPPELGELDLHMTVEKGGALRLSIGAERADLRDLLQGGLEQLKKQLQDSGLQVAHAEVHTRSGQGGGQGSASWGQALGADEAVDANEAAAPQRAGWISTQGLDFWV
jgi:flagellar hook-length control protein FliK